MTAIPIKPKKAYSFDDLLLEPGYSTLSSRSHVKLNTTLGNMELFIPIVSAPMDTVTGRDMALFMSDQGGLGFLHRYTEIQKNIESIKFLKEQYKTRCGVAINTKTSSFDVAKYLEAGVDAIILDIAHQDTKYALAYLEGLSTWLGVVGIKEEITLVSGNLATPDAARRAIDAGVDALRVGIGAGSACTTRKVAGIGIPQLTAINEVAHSIFPHKTTVIADGGIRNSGDIVKALAAGAHVVMLGGLLAAYSVSERPGEFRGMASRAARESYTHRKELGPEGAEFYSVAEDKNYKETFADLVEGVRQGIAYTGGHSIDALQRDPKWVRVSANSTYELGAHFGYGH